jgi:hypothetical protein
MIEMITRAVKTASFGSSTIKRNGNVVKGRKARGIGRLGKITEKAEIKYHTKNGKTIISNSN